MKSTHINLCINETLLKSEKYRQRILDFIFDWVRKNGKPPTVVDIRNREEFQDLFSYEIECFIKQVEEI